MANLDDSVVVGVSPYRYWQPLLAASVGTFLLLVYTTVVTAALPSIGRGLGASYTALQWVVDVFTVALAALLLVCGSLSDRIGRKRLYLTGLWIFGLSTLGCGLAISPVMLVVARAVQGLAGAAMFATILPLVGASYDGPDRARAFAAWGTVAGIASAVGTFAGGAVAQLLGWRWIFFGSLPLCAIALILGYVALGSDSSRGGSTDYPGMVTFTVASGGVTYAVIAGGDSGWFSLTTLLPLVIAVVAAVGFVRMERTRPDPLVPRSLFATRRLTGVLFVAFGYYFATFGTLPVVSIWLQRSCALSPLSTSAVLAVQVVAFVVVSATVSARLHSADPSRTLGGSTLVIAAGCACGTIVLLSPTWQALIPVLVVTGVGAGIVSPIFPAVAMGSVPEEFGGTAGAAANTARQLGLAWGVALCGSLFAGRHDDVRAAAHTVVVIFGVCAVLAAVTGLVGGALPRGTRTATP